MLVLQRKVGERIFIGDDITVEVMDVKHGKVRLGVVAPKHVPVDREEVWNAKIKQEQQYADDNKADDATCGIKDNLQL